MANQILLQRPGNEASLELAPKDDATLLSEAQGLNFFPNQLKLDLVEAYQQLEISASHLAHIAVDYSKKVNEHRQIGEELSILYKQLAPDPESESNYNRNFSGRRGNASPEVYAWDAPDQVQIRAKISALSQRAENIENDLLDNHIPELGIQPYSYEVHSRNDPELTGKNFPSLTAGVFTNLLKDKAEQLLALLQSQDVANRLNLHSLYRDALPYTYGRAIEAGTVVQNKEEFLKDFRKYVKAQLLQFSLGIDTTYAKTPGEHAEAVARMEVVTDFEHRYNTRLPYPGFTHGRQPRRPDDGYLVWAEAVVGKLSEDLIASKIFGALKAQFSDYSPLVKDFYSRDTQEYLRRNSKNYCGFHQLEAMLDLVDSARIAPRLFSQNMRLEVSNYVVRNSSSDAGLAHDLGNFTRQPETVLPAMLAYMEHNGKSHFVGAMGTNHSTLAFTSGCLEIIRKLQQKDEIPKLKEHLTAEQYRLVELIIDPRTNISHGINYTSAGFLFSCPALGIFIENLAEACKERLNPGIFSSWLSGHALNHQAIKEITTMKELPEILLESGLAPCKLPKHFDIDPLFSAIALSKSSMCEFIYQAAQVLVISPREAKLFAANIVNSPLALSAPSRKAILVEVLESVASGDPYNLQKCFSKLAESASKAFENTVSATPLKTSPVGELITKLWNSEAEILLLGEEHNLESHAKAEVELFDDLVLAGMTDIAFELPKDFIGKTDAFLMGDCSLDDLKSDLQSQIKEHEFKIDSLINLIAKAKAHGINVHFIDMNSKEYRALETLISMSNLDQTDLEKGLASGPQFDLFYKSRNAEMARALDLIKTSVPEAKIVFIGGANHISERIEAKNIGAYLKEFGIASKPVEIIGGGSFSEDESLDVRLNPEIFAAKSKGIHRNLFSGIDRSGLAFVHLPQN